MMAQNAESKRALPIARQQLQEPHYWFIISNWEYMCFPHTSISSEVSHSSIKLTKLKSWSWFITKTAVVITTSLSYFSVSYFDLWKNSALLSACTPVPPLYYKLVIFSITLERNQSKNIVLLLCWSEQCCDKHLIPYDLPGETVELLCFWLAALDLVQSSPVQ